MADRNKEEVIRPYKGMWSDSSPIDQPEGTYPMAWNAVKTTENGDINSLSNEGSTSITSQIPVGYIAIGSQYLENNNTLLFLCHDNDLDNELGIIDRDGKYTTLVNAQLGFKCSQQIQSIYRLRKGQEQTVYWIDPKPRVFIVNKIEKFYTSAYINFLSSGLPGPFTGKKWDVSSFDLVKSYDKVPSFTDVEILEYGNIPNGSISAAIRYLDNDLNPTAWISTTNPVNIFNDNTDLTYSRIRGARNLQSSAQNWGKANKSVKFTITDLDDNFPFYQIAIIQAVSNTGKPTKALLSSPISSNSSEFIYSGNDENLTEISLEEIIIDAPTIREAKTIEQLENRVTFGNVKTGRDNYCDYQAYASKISADLVTKEVILNSVESEPNQKNAKSTFMFRSYMPGQPCSFGVIYLHDDGALSPAFHIPGKNVLNTSSKMKNYQGSDKYLKIHDCTGNNYWGTDESGQTLTAKPIRFHRFPYRSEVNKPLVSLTTTTVNINKYRLSFKIDLASGQSYPLDTNGDPIPLSFTVQYKPVYSANPVNYSGYITDSSMGLNIVIYDDVNPLAVVSGSNFIVFDPTSQLMGYQSTPTFVITENAVETYTVDSIKNAYTSDIFGISFSNIEKPADDVIGFYIVRQELHDSDKMVIDNAIVGNNTRKDNYKAFGLWIPKTPDNNKDDKSAWVFSPEYEFFGKKFPFSELKPEGEYIEFNKWEGKPMFTDKLAVSAGTPRGIIVDDVYPGTSYNKEVHKKKEKDDDGFALAIGYRAFSFYYSPFSTPPSLPAIDKSFYLTATSSKLDGQDIHYNMSCDNKMIITKFKTSLNFSIFNTNNNYYPDFDSTIYTNYNFSPIYKGMSNKLLYVSLTNENNKSSYSDFLTRPYYKEHNNPVYFGNNHIVNNFEVYNGDAYISPMTLTNTVFWEQRMGDRAKKDKTWQIVLGVVLVIIGIVLTVITAGASLGISAAGVAALTTVATLAISYGVSVAMSGIKFEQMKAMIDADYAKGLKDCIKDQDTMFQLDGQLFPGPQPLYTASTPIALNSDMRDDAFIWFSDSLLNIWIESYIPIGLRSGITAATTDFMDSPEPFNRMEFESYLTEKLTVLDRERGSGRLYKGYPSSEVYDINLDYMRMNKEKSFIHLPIEYDCCSNDADEYRTRIYYSQQSFQEENVDNYRIFLPNNYRDIEGEHGEITNLYKINNNLFIHTTEALWSLPANVQERVTDELISFIGTGAFFSHPPRKIVDEDLGSAGSQHKWATIKTKNGVLFVSELEHQIYLHDGGIPKSLTDEGRSKWALENVKSYLVNQVYTALGINFINANNPANSRGVGYHSTYDNNKKRILITKKDYLITPTFLNGFREVYNMGEYKNETSPHPLLPGLGLDNESGKFYYFNVITTIINSVTYYVRSATEVTFDNPVYFEDKSWTTSWDIKDKSWVSMHSYIPNLYFHNFDNTYAFRVNDRNIYKLNHPHKFQKFFGTYYPFIVDIVSNEAPLVEKIYDYFTLQTVARKWDASQEEFVEDRFTTFNKAIFSNRRQCSGVQVLLCKDKDQSTGYMGNQVQNTTGQMLISRAESNWNINDIRDYRIDYSKPIFSSTWNDIATSYPIDKVVNNALISFTKSWTELESFRDKYLVIRLIFDNFAGNPVEETNLVVSYTIIPLIQSER